MSHVSQRLPETSGFCLGVYVFKDPEIVDYAAPYGVFSVAQRFDPELDAFSHRRCHALGADEGRLHCGAELQLPGSA